MTTQKNKNLDPQDLQNNPHIVYHRHVDRISKTMAVGGDWGTLVNGLFSMTAHLHDTQFKDEWETLHEWPVGNDPSDSTIGVAELRFYEWELLMEMMARRGMLEEAKAIGRV